MATRLFKRHTGSTGGGKARTNAHNKRTDGPSAPNVRGQCTYSSCVFTARTECLAKDAFSDSAVVFENTFFSCEPLRHNDDGYELVVSK